MLGFVASCVSASSTQLTTSYDAAAGGNGDAAVMMVAVIGP